MSEKIGMYTKEEILKYMTDCDGPFLGRSMFDAIFEKIDKLQQENMQLKRMLDIKEKLDKKEITYEWDFKDMFDMREENDTLKQQLKDKDEKISKVKELLKNPSTIDYEMYGLEYSRDIVDIKLLLEILESNKED